MNGSEPGNFFGKWQELLIRAYRLLFCRSQPEITSSIVIVTRSDIFPTDHGAAVKIVKTAEALSRKQRKVYLCTGNRKEYYCFEHGTMQTAHYPLWLRLCAFPGRIATLRLLLRGFPLSNSFLYLPLTDFSYSLRTTYLATRFSIKIFIADFPAYVVACRTARNLLGGRILLVEHNVEYERLREQIKNLSNSSYRMLKQFELLMCKAADTVITVSDKDREKLLLDGVTSSKVHTIPHGVDLAAYSSTPVMNVRGHYGIARDVLLLVYHGPYSYFPNLQAMSLMATELLPRLIELGLNILVLAIGNKPPRKTLHPSIIFTGSIQDLAAVLPAADIAVVPLIEGGGTRMKILDYFAAGIPVISTKKGIEGIPVQHGREALILDDFDEICEAVRELATDQEKARAQTQNASAFVARYSWDAIADLYISYF